MEVVFLLFSMIISISSIYIIDRIFYSHREVIIMYKKSRFLRLIHLIIGLSLMLHFFIILCALNNTFWHLPYLMVK